VALKGTAVIELTNVRTGEKERYVEENLITNALYYLHKPIPSLRLPWLGLTTTSFGYESQQYDPVYPYLLGGIVLWQDSLPEDASIVAQPHGAKMVGCAAYKQVNTTTSPKRGSYNESESYLTTSSVETSMKFVYDFATNQANGKINCLSLTSWEGGWNGFGGNDARKDPITKTFGLYNDYIGTENVVPFKLWYSNVRRVLYIDPEEDTFYEVTGVTTSSVTIGKFRANLTMKSVFRDAFTSHGLLETISISLPTTMTGANTYVCNYDIDNNKTYIVVSPSSSSVAKSGRLYVIEIDMDSYTATVHTMTNPIGDTLYVSKEYITCYGGYLYYSYTSASSVRRISMADSSYANLYVPSGNGVYSDGIFIADGMIYFWGRYTKDSNNYRMICFIDPSDASVHCTGSSYPSNYFGRYDALVPIKGFPLIFYMGYYTTNGGTDY